MKILYFHQYFSTPQGSSGLRPYKNARALISAGHEVTIICGNSDKGKTGLDQPFLNGMRSGIIDNIKVIEFQLNYSNLDSFQRRTLIFIRYAIRGVFVAMRIKSDLIFASSTPLTASVPGIVARWLSNRRFIFEVRDLWPELPRKMDVIKNPIILGMMSLLEKISYYSAHACIGLSPGIVTGIRNRSQPQKKIAMIPNGSDLDVFNDPELVSNRPAGTKQSDLVAIFTGAHGIANGLMAVIDAAEVLKNLKRLDIKLVFVGDGKLKPALQNRSNERELHNCIFLNPVPKKQLAEYLKGADVGMMILANVPAFYYGTSPNKFFDYIAAGLPVLNNYPGWLADMINEGNIGIVVPPDDPNSIANALIYMADNRHVLDKMKINAKNMAREEFDRNILAQRFVEFIENNVVL